MSHQRAVSAEDYTRRAITSIFEDGQARGLNYSGVSIDNDEAGFVNLAALDPNSSGDMPDDVDAVHTTIYWGNFEHPLHTSDLELMYDRLDPVEWAIARRLILGSAVGSVPFKRHSLGQNTDPVGAGNDLSREQLEKICANAGAPFSLFQIARALGSDRHNVGFLWFPTILESSLALEGIQSAAARRIDWS